MEIASLLLHENSLRVYSAILIPHFKRYLQISLATPTHFRFLVPPIFVKNVKATVLYTYIVLTFIYFVNVCIAGFTPKSFRLLMQYCIFWTDHIPSVDILLQITPTKTLCCSISLYEHLCGRLN